MGDGRQADQAPGGPGTTGGVKHERGVVRGGACEAIEEDTARANKWIVWSQRMLERDMGNKCSR